MRKKTLQNLLNETNESLATTLNENEQLRERLIIAEKKIVNLENAPEPNANELDSLKVENDELKAKINNINEQNDGVIAELEERINLLTSENNTLKGELFDAKKYSEDLMLKFSNIQTSTEADYEDIPLPPPPVVHKPVSADKKDPEAFDYASTIISKIVLKSATLRNTINTSNDQNANELITLAIGKTEMLKSEVLQVVLSDLSTQDKMAKMDNLFGDVNEYFDSLEAHLFKE